ncbi:hypothetical protein C8Q76DRAFT_759483 [Earliella scabrosa]|nr:hypothetical protein C8Q76DRAFT_759483 [Earliella scabrosa]
MILLDGADLQNGETTAGPMDDVAPARLFRSAAGRFDSSWIWSDKDAHFLYKFGLLNRK